MLTLKAREFVASNTDDKLRFPSDAGKRLGGVCPPTYQGFLDFVQQGIQGRVIDARAAMKHAWEHLAKSVLNGIGYTVDPRTVNPDGFTRALMQIESDEILAADVIRVVHSLQQTTRKVFNHSEFAYNPSADEARGFVSYCASLRAIIFEALQKDRGSRRRTLP